MTLLVYANGVLAADTGCTRFGSREQFRKIRQLVTEDKLYTLAYAGEVDAIEAHWQHFLTNRTTIVDKPLNCEGIMVVVPMSEGLMPPNPDHTVASFNCFDTATGGGIPVTSYDFEVVGANSAVVAALAIYNVKPHWTGERIVPSVAEVCRDCDTRFGVDYVDFNRNPMEIHHD